MKLGSLKSQSRDGDLCVVSRDLTRAVRATHIAPNLRSAVENWSEIAPRLKSLFEALQSNDPAVQSFKVDQTRFHSPMPRSFQWADGSAFLHHVKLVRKARNAEMPPSFYEDPLMYQGSSDDFLAPTDPIPQVDFSHGTDFEGEVAVITDDVPMGVTAADALKHIQLVMIVNDVSLRGLIPEELAKGFGFLNSKPHSAFAPFAVTLDELGSHWRDGRIHLNLDVRLNGEFFGNADAGAMHFHFGQLIAHLAKTRTVRAGSIVGSGTVSNEDPARGSSCLVEKRMLETIASGKAVTSFMKRGDRVQMEMKLPNGESLFGMIDQTVS